MPPNKVIAVMLVYVLTLAGCFMSNYDPSGYRYVLRKGDPEQIANWTVRQDDPGRVWHAQLALSTYTEPLAPKSRDGAAAAADAFMRINNAYHAGWKFKSTLNPQANPRFIPGRCYQHIAEAASFDAHARKQFLAIEPPLASEFHKQWVAAAQQYGINVREPSHDN